MRPACAVAEALRVLAEHAALAEGGLREVIDEAAAIRRAISAHVPAFRSHVTHYAAHASADDRAPSREHAAQLAAPVEALAALDRLVADLNRVAEMWRAFPADSELAVPPRGRGRPKHALERRVTDLLRAGGFTMPEIAKLLGVSVEKLRGRRRRKA